jgi:poly-gamma-glutamate capsule biosynthesis protein CapA/YwtB (metallophosphatase superfamily)
VISGVSRLRTLGGSPDRFEIVWVGDVLLADSAQPHLVEHGYDWPFEFLRPLMAGDYLIGNAEGPVTLLTEKIHPNRRWSYNADPASAAALAKVGFNAMSLSNNHALDRGPAGLADTVLHLTEAGVSSFGAGMNTAEAAAPLLVPTPFGPVAVTGIGRSWQHGEIAEEQRPGTIGLSTESIVHQKKLADDAGARWVVAFVHWGSTYKPVSNAQREHAAAFASAGYDLVIGAGSHVAQQVDIVDGMPVLYSLGNFTFGSLGRFTAEMPGYGLVARTVFDSTGLVNVQLSTITTNNHTVAFQPRPSDRTTSREVLTGLGTAVRVGTQQQSGGLRNLFNRRVVGQVNLGANLRVSANLSPEPAPEPVTDHARQART